MVVRQGREVIDQVERGAILAGEMEAVPLDPHDQISLPAAVLEEPVPRLGAAVVAVADTHLAYDRRAVGQGFGTFNVGQFEVREATRAEIVDAMHAPVSALAARFGNAGAIGHTYRTDPASAELGWPILPPAGER